jgi:hypothetical protein
MPSETDLEAVGILSEGMRRRTVIPDGRWRKAGTALLASLVASAQKAGMDSETRAGAGYTTFVDSSTAFGVSLAVRVTGEAIEIGVLEEPERVSGWRPVEGLRLDGDHILGEAYDTTRHPVPGAPRERRGGVAVVAEALDARFDERRAASPG